MKKNLGTLDRSARILSTVLLIGASVWAPWPEPLRYGVLIPTAIYLLFSALSGTCVGYKLMGLSTCPAKSVT